MTDHYEASIRTPVTPSRWKDFDTELTSVWEAVIDALASGDKPKIAVAVLTFVYYWYNFMPVARGTAVCGHITLLSLFALAGMPLTAPIPVVRPASQWIHCRIATYARACLLSYLSLSFPDLKGG